MDLILETPKGVSTTVPTIEYIDYKKDVLMNKTKHHIIELYRLLQKDMKSIDNKLMDKNIKLENELNELNNKFNIQTSLENELATVEVDLNTPNANLNIPHDPVIMYNHSLACKVEEENTLLRKKVTDLSLKCKKLKKVCKDNEKDLVNENKIEELEEDIKILKITNEDSEKELNDKIMILNKDYAVLFHSVKNGTSTKYNELVAVHDKMKDKFDIIKSRCENAETKNYKLNKHIRKLDKRCSDIRELTYSIQYPLSDGTLDC
tara:strand:+ start:282 stop:1070 length:789 start_codon:yes stop_codon:yes gene_type:complete